MFDFASVTPPDARIPSNSMPTPSQPLITPDDAPKPSNLMLTPFQLVETTTDRSDFCN